MLNNNKMETWNTASELVLRTILLLISDDKDLNNIKFVNKKINAITKSDRFCQEKLVIEYPNFVKDKVDFANLSWFEFYYLISKFNSFDKVEEREYGSQLMRNPFYDFRIEISDLDEDNFHNNRYYPTFDVRNPNLNKPGLFPKLLTKCEEKNTAILGQFLYYSWSKLNLDKMFSERFLSRLLLKGVVCHQYHAEIYGNIIQNIFQSSQTLYNCNDYDNSHSEDSEDNEKLNFENLSPQIQYIFKHNDRCEQTTGLFYFITRNLLYIE